MAEWLYEEGIGENRAVLVEGDEIVEAAIETPGEVRAGAVIDGRLAEILVPGRRGIVATEVEAMLIEPLPAHLTQGQAVRVLVQREAIAEAGRRKLAKGRITDEAPRRGPDLVDRIGPCTRLRPSDPDRFEQAGWSELLDEAVHGRIAFPGGELRMSLTPAMTLFDVDGHLPPAELAVAGAAAAGKAVRRFGVAGSIGIDLPTLSSKQDRQRAAAALDGALPQPFERTGVNGFGFLQLIRRRERPSLPELMQYDPASSAARALLRRAERLAGAGTTLLSAAPQLIRVIEGNPDWTVELQRRTGRPLRLQPDDRLSIWSGHVQTVQS